MVPTIMENRREEFVNDEWHVKPDHVARAPRFPIQAPFSFRTGGEKSWHEGTTINISRSGVLFKSDMVFDPKTVLEMRIAFPPEMTGDVETNVICWGPIVRLQPCAPEEQFHSIAASFFRYRFQRD
jgi:hypothetical protein